MAEHLARVENANLEIVRAAALLHDIDSNQQPNPIFPSHQSHADQRTKHHLASADFAQLVLETEGWPEESIAAVQHCIRAHRFRDRDDQPQTLEAKILYDADKLDAIGAIGVARAIAFAVQKGNPINSQPSDKFIQTGEKEPGEAHSAYHEYLYKLRVLIECLYTPTALAIAEERHRFMVEFFEHLSSEQKGER